MNYAEIIKQITDVFGQVVASLSSMLATPEGATVFTLLCVGWYLKNMTDINNRRIPLILGAIGVTAGVILFVPEHQYTTKNVTMAVMKGLGFMAFAVAWTEVWKSTLKPIVDGILAKYLQKWLSDKLIAKLGIVAPPANSPDSTPQSK